jgi:hypothetical protein
LEDDAKIFYLKEKVQNLEEELNEERVKCHYWEDKYHYESKKNAHNSDDEKKMVELEAEINIHIEKHNHLTIEWESKYDHQRRDLEDRYRVMEGEWETKFSHIKHEYEEIKHKCHDYADKIHYYK